MTATCPMSPTAGISRRGILGAAVGGVVAGAVLSGAAADASTPTDTTAYPFEGPHQAGILQPAQRSAAFVAFDVTALDAQALKAMFQTLTGSARYLTAGKTPPDAGMVSTAADNGLLGPDPSADGLTVTVSVGASLFDHRYGLAKQKPAQLRQMDEFPDDALDRTRCDGDLLLQICANNADTVNRALRLLMRATRADLQIRWRLDGFASPARPTGSPRNLLGFRDGTANREVLSSTSTTDDIVWTQAGGAEPAWVAGGSYHVVRLIRMFVEFWDRVSVIEQQQMIGRDRDTGAPLTGGSEFDIPDYIDDPLGDAIPLGSHIRRANPRTQASAAQRMLRRGYNYDAGTDQAGELDCGLIFNAFNADLDRQFVAVQRRLAGEPLVDYISPFGGGYFFALPGVQGGDDFLGRGLFV